MSALRKQMQADMVLRGMAVRTQQVYLSNVSRLAAYYHRSPAELTQQEVQQYLLYLIEDRKQAWSSTNQAAYAIRFLFHVTLGRPVYEFVIPGRREPSNLPEILSREEVERILDACQYVTHRALLTTTYAAGLRVAETCALKVADIDSGRMMLRVVSGKGGKDRYTLLSPRLLETLRQYWRAVHPAIWLFAKGDGTGPIGVSQAQKIYYRAKQRAGIAKRGGIHGLRHAFATHLLEGGVGVHAIKELMGHEDVSTTERYLHLRQQVVQPDSPLDF
jgi:integrase/recombinase XerD